MSADDQSRCTAHTRTGRPCKARPVTGATVCRMHGGSAPQVRAAAQRRLQEAQATRDVQLFAGRRDIHPAEALLELVHWTAGEVDYWRQRVRDIETSDLTWGVTKEKTGGDDHGITSEAKPHIAYVMLVQASDRLERYASAALKAGIDERRVRLAESQGALVAETIRRILARLSLSADQQLLVGEVVPQELRALAGGGS
ncbi:HGGxSTG domain-containing protein [Angustibacter sp. McL0619]|uniref:HGGxSTG domain-containing protein n=1 Tax=Angustibacter sp. McL0619 TaxID=3415676 RepID=UPI003CF1ACF3